MADGPKNAKNRPVHENHRERMRRRVEKYGLDSLEEHEALEYLLFFVIPRRDTNPLAHALIERFGSFAGVLEASEEELRAVEGIGPAAARFLHMLPAVDRYYAVSRSKGTRRFTTTAQLGEYLVPLFRGQKRESLLLLALDERRRLLRTVWLNTGTVSAVDIGVNKIATETVAAGASIVVLAHNHPGGVALPSKEDIVATGNAMRALGLLGVHVQDHIIVAGEEYTSLRDTHRLPFYNFKTGELSYLG